MSARAAFYFLWGLGFFLTGLGHFLAGPAMIVLAVVYHKRFVMAEDRSPEAQGGEG